MDFTPARNVLSHSFTGRLRPRHFAGECAHKPRAVSLHDQTVSKGKSKGSSFFAETFTLKVGLGLARVILLPHCVPVS